MRSRAAVILSSSFAAVCVGAHASDADRSTWPQWRGPTRDGRCDGPRWPDVLDAEHLKRLWRVEDLGESYAGPIVGDAMVYTTESRDMETEAVLAHDRESGELAWRHEWSGSMQVPFFAARNGSWVRSTPAYDGDAIYAGGMQDRLVCLDAITGDERWTVDFKERYGTRDPAFGLVCSPLVVGDDLYVQAALSLVKLDKRTGDTIWRSLVEDDDMMASAFSSPVVATLQDRVQLVVQARAYLAGVDPASGNELWRRDIESFRGMNILTPLPLDDAVFTATYGGRAQRLRVEEVDDEFFAVPVWNNKTQGNMTSPVLIDGHAYLMTRSNRFTCIDMESGEIRWISPPTGDEYWSLIAQGDRILALANTGRLRLLRADPSEYAVLAEHQIANEETWAHLAIAGDVLYVRELTALTAYRWR